MKNQKGLTVIELMIASGVSAILFMCMGVIMLSLMKDQNQLKEAVEAQIDTGVGERFILADLRAVAGSYNNLQTLDDNGKLFFDLNLEPEGAGSRRTLTLSPTRPRPVDFILQQSVTGETLIYDPVAAYDVGEIPADLNVAAPLNFRSLNHRNWVSSQRPRMWTEGQLLMLDSPSFIRPLRGDGLPDRNVIARSPVFIGEVGGSSLTTPSPLTSVLIRTHPLNGRVIASADQFLRELPAIGGGIPIVRVRGISWVRYQLLADPGRTTRWNLWRTVYSKGRFGNGVLVAEDVRSVQFIRESIQHRMISFKIEKGN